MYYHLIHPAIHLSTFPQYLDTSQYIQHVLGCIGCINIQYIHQYTSIPRDLLMEDNADKDRSKNNDKVSGTITSDAVDKESGVLVSATPSPSKNARPRDPAIPSIPAGKVITRGGGQKSKARARGGRGSGQPAAVPGARD
jgi:hypothetical protein